jgi:hypothetical protein
MCVDLRSAYLSVVTYVGWLVANTRGPHLQHTIVTDRGFQVLWSPKGSVCVTSATSINAATYLPTLPSIVSSRLESEENSTRPISIEVLSLLHQRLYPSKHGCYLFQQVASTVPHR